MENIDAFATWEKETALKYQIKPVKVRTIWAIGQGILKSMRPKTDSGREFLDDNGKLTVKGKELYNTAEKARRTDITKSLKGICSGSTDGR